MKYVTYLTLIILSICFNCSSNTPIDEPDQSNNELYFPPIDSNTWETLSISELNWNEPALQPLLDFLDEKGTKSFVILYNGRLVVEAYMNGHNKNTPWYWASAGKTITTTLSGIAQEEGLIDINNKVSDYIGTGWTNVPLEKENLITCKHLLSMTSGLDDSIGNSVLPENLEYTADAGTRWAYHNVYKKMQDVIATASGSTFTNYFNNKIKNKIGMTGSWLELNDFNVFWSNTRSMARFGLMIYAKGKWNDTQILTESFLNEATNSSQNMNKSYGYLWWLNGKSSFKLPGGSQIEHSGELVPNAPSDMFAALGKNDQKIYIVPSKKLVVVRMGNKADIEAAALSAFDNELWEKLNGVITN